MVGKRTIKELAWATVPSRIYFVLVILAVCAAIGATLFARMFEHVGAPNWLAKEMNTLASTFRVMPIWFLIGGSLSQVAARIDRAVTEARRWWNDRQVDGLPYNDPRWRQAQQFYDEVSYEVCGVRRVSNSRQD